MQIFKSTFAYIELIGRSALNKKKQPLKIPPSAPYSSLSSSFSILLLFFHYQKVFSIP